MRPRTQTTRTNHLGYDVGASRKIPDGAVARAAPAECLEANKSNALTRFALTLFRLLCFGFGVIDFPFFGKSSLLRINQRHHSLRTRLGTHIFFI